MKRVDNYLRSEFANTIKRTRGFRGKGRNRTSFRCVNLFNIYGEELSIDISSCNGGGEDETPCVCECDNNCKFHTPKENNLIVKAMADKNLTPWPPEKVAIKPGGASRAEVEERLRKQAIGTILDAVIAKEALAQQLTPAKIVDKTAKVKQVEQV